MKATIFLYPKMARLSLNAENQPRAFYRSLRLSAWKYTRAGIYYKDFYYTELAHEAFKYSLEWLRDRKIAINRVDVR